VSRLSAFGSMLVVTLVAAPPPASAADTSCKERCESWCMGNDTPTGRAECLKTEKCSSKPVCPSDARGTTSGIKSDPGIRPPSKPKVQVPKFDSGGVVRQ
jgi:hypothetical protein